MARRDFYHDAVKRAIQRDGWTVTQEPLYLPFGSTQLEVDLAAEKIFAQRGAVRIAVEVKNFLQENMNASELQKSLGQYQLYDVLIEEENLSYRLYLAITESAYKTVFSTTAVQSLIRRNNMGLIIFNPETETIVEWKH